MKRQSKTISLTLEQINLDAFDSDFAVFVNSNQHNNYHLLALGVHKVIEPSEKAFEALRTFKNNTKDWLFGYFSYDLKNQTEELSSKNLDGLFFPEMVFIQPEVVIEFKNNTAQIHFLDNDKAENIITKIKSQAQSDTTTDNIQLISRISKNEYLDKIKQIHNHIQLGDIYEMNFCQEFYGENIKINPWLVYQKLNEKSEAPFSTFWNYKDHYALCASPERYLQKTGDRILSQPIKGTRKRGKSKSEDARLKDELRASEKETSENVMIVDLVRNDLSRIAKLDSVKVDELFGIYSFSTVHQMISTVSCILDDKFDGIDAIETSFPMGSMTGAPKYSSMQIIEELETTKRGLFSGSIGFIKPNGDYDFNVVIRSILYNKLNEYLSIMVGGAITIQANAEEEFKECMLKADALFQTLNADLC